MKRLVTVVGLAMLIGAGAAHAHGSDNGPWGGGHGVRGMGHMGMGPMLDFSAVAGEDADTVDRAALEAFGVEQLAPFDADGNGELSRDELAQALPARERSPLMVFAPDRTYARADHVLRMHGAEEEGAVAVDAVVGRQVDMLFARLDRNGDGVISREEAGHPAGGHGMRNGGRD